MSEEIIIYRNESDNAIFYWFPPHLTKEEALEVIEKYPECIELTTHPTGAVFITTDGTIFQQLIRYKDKDIQELDW